MEHNNDEIWRVEDVNISTWRGMFPDELVQREYV